MRRAPALPANLSRLMTIVCLHSLTAHGVVGLKPFMSVLGAHCLPIPTVLLSGPGDMPGVQRMPTDAARLLEATLAALAAEARPTVLMIGYLADAAQAGAIAAVVDRHRAALASVVVDPVSGDRGKAYVAPDLLEAWPRLLEQADVALPNATEVGLLTGLRGDAATEAWCRHYPNTMTIVTGADAGGEMVTRIHHGGGVHNLRTRRRPGNFNGTGDLFAALWLRDVHLRGVSPQAAALSAAEQVGAAIDQALAAGARDLPLTS